MKRVVIVVDGTEASMQALRGTLRNARGTIDQIDLVNVQPLFSRHVARWTSRRDRDAWRQERAACILEPAAKLVRLAGIRCETHVFTAFPMGASDYSPNPPRSRASNLEGPLPSR